MTEDFLDTIMAWMLPIVTIAMVVGVQFLFWGVVPSVQRPPSTKSEPVEDTAHASSSLNDHRDQETFQEKTGGLGIDNTDENEGSDKNRSTASLPSTPTKSDATPASKNGREVKTTSNDDDEEEDLFKMNDQWRCACEGGFLPPGLLKSFGGAEAMMRLGTGQCYHKQT